MISALYTGASGILAHGKGMQIISNNLSNVNTVGFKQVMMLYQDLGSDAVVAGSNGRTNMSQRGLGVSGGLNRRLFTQGGFEHSSTITDVSIKGKGFFGVSKGNEIHYTRAGNFRFDKDGSLQDPSGWTVLGRPIVNGVEAATARPLNIDFSDRGGVGHMPGKATSNLKLLSHLGGMKNQSAQEGNPFFSLVSSWDGTQNPPVGAQSYSYSEPIRVYDSNGVERKATIYYDLAGEQNGQQAIEYMVTMDPSLDASAAQGTPAAGLLLAGTMSFSATGNLQNLTAFTLSGADPKNLNSWVAAPLQNGIPSFTATFEGTAVQQLTLDFGLRLQGAQPYTTAADVNVAGAEVYAAAKGAVRDPQSMTAYGKNPNSVLQHVDGYSEGFLRSMQISEDGMMTGHYSNNQSLDLARIALFRFPSEDGLRAEGGNHFSATTESGAADEGQPGQDSFGTVQQSALEQSNVDFAREFTSMILTQRGFQMNSKVVTTSDMMLQKALELKR